MSYTSITAHFQDTLTKRGFRVSAVYLGDRKLGIKGSRREVTKASALIRHIYTLNSFTDLGCGKVAAIFEVPSVEAAEARFDDYKATHPEVVD